MNDPVSFAIQAVAQQSSLPVKTQATCPRCGSDHVAHLIERGEFVDLYHCGSKEEESGKWYIKTVSCTECQRDQLSAKCDKLDRELYDAKERIEQLESDLEDLRNGVDRV